jgi:hypothetical protein
MTNLKLLAAAAFSLALAGPVSAATVTTDELPGAYQGRGSQMHQIRAQDFDHFNFGIARPTYHSGWGGPYGDGDYPGSVDQNFGPPYWGSH